MGCLFKGGCLIVSLIILAIIIIILVILISRGYVHMPSFG